MRHSLVRHIFAASSALALIGGVTAFGGESPARAAGLHDCFREGVVRMRQRDAGHWGCNASYPHFEASSVGLHDEWLVVVEENESGDTTILVLDFQHTIAGNDAWIGLDAGDDAWTAMVVESPSSDRDWLVLIEQVTP